MFNYVHTEMNLYNSVAIVANCKLCPLIYHPVISPPNDLFVFIRFIISRFATVMNIADILLS